MSTTTDQLRRLQYAANMLSLSDFIIALDLDVDDYSRDKYRAFRAFGALGEFDNNTLETLIMAYEREAQELDYAHMATNCPPDWDAE